MDVSGLCSQTWQNRRESSFKLIYRNLYTPKVFVSEILSTMLSVWKKHQAVSQKQFFFKLSQTRKQRSSNSFQLITSYFSNAFCIRLFVL